MDVSVVRQERYLDRNFYADATRFKQIQAAVGSEIDLHARAGYDPVDGLVKQLNPETVTWAIDLLENQYGLPNLVAAPIEERRERVLALVRSAGAMTTTRAESIANAYENGTVEIDPDFEHYVVYVWFVDLLGNPPHMEALLASLRRSYPAHIAIQPIIVYTDWNNLDQAELSWNALDGMAITWDAFPTTAF